MKAGGIPMMSVAETLRRRREQLDLLLTDVFMPKLGGMALREQILPERPSIKVLLLSGAAEQLPEGVEFLPSRSKPRV